MVFRDYNYRNNFVRLEGDLIVELMDYNGPFQGYFQHHAVGMVLFGIPPVSFLKIGDQKIDVSLIKEVRYKANGNIREVDIIDFPGKPLMKFTYKEFWITEVDMIEFALGMPDDIERDLLKFISENIK